MPAYLNVSIIVATTLCFMAGLMTFAERRKINGAFTVVWFVIGVAAYLLLSFKVDLPVFLSIVLLFLSAMVPVWFLFAARFLFEDRYKVNWYHLLALLFLQLAMHLHFIFQKFIEAGDLALDAFYVGGQISSFGFLLAGIMIAVKSASADLVMERLKFRYIFVASAAVLIVLVVLAEARPLSTHARELFLFLIATSVTFLAIAFMIRNFSLHHGFFMLPEQLKKDNEENFAESITDNETAEKLESALFSGHIYRREGLTIGSLAETLGIQEYRLRKHINKGLGYRNFNDFLNRHRVEEATIILKDKNEKRTVQEISYALGYASIAPFNKAFREITGKTPTEYKKHFREPN